MSGMMIAIYRLPQPRSTQVGQVKIVKDRKQRYYIDGAMVSAATETGEYTALERTDGRIFYVKTADLAAVPGPRR